MVFKVPSIESQVSEELGEVCGGALPCEPEAGQTWLGLPPPVLQPEQLSSCALGDESLYKVVFWKIK